MAKQHMSISKGKQYVLSVEGLELTLNRTLQSVLIATVTELVLDEFERLEVIL